MPLTGKNPEVAAAMQNLMKIIPRTPKAIVVVTAHWQNKNVTVSSGEKHPLLFDYNVSSPECFEYKYDAPGSPEIAFKIQELLKAQGIQCDTDDTRGWDHGVFVPLMFMVPDASIPVIQLSLKDNQDAKEHINIGLALQSLREEDIFIVGSGFSFHNFKYIMGNDDDLKKIGSEHSKVFNDWLTTSLT